MESRHYCTPSQLILIYILILYVSILQINWPKPLSGCRQSRLGRKTFRAEIFLGQVTLHILYWPPKHSTDEDKLVERKSTKNKQTKKKQQKKHERTKLIHQRLLKLPVIVPTRWIKIWNGIKPQWFVSHSLYSTTPDKPVNFNLKFRVCHSNVSNIF